MNFIKRWIIERAIKKGIRRIDMNFGKGWRTMAINVASGLAFFLTWDQLTAWVSPKVLAEGIVLLNLFLRWITTSPVGSK